MKFLVNGVTFHYRSSLVLEGISFEVACHEVVAVLGPNGVGKTTLLKCLNAILKAESGAIRVDGENVPDLSVREIARRLSYVAQKSEASRITVFDAVLLGRRPHIVWKTSDRDLQLANAAIRRLNLEDLALRYINELSGGELQKVGIARALVQEPRVLLLDEPTSSLDLKNQIEILKTIREVAAGHEVSAVMTMHNLNMALRYADRFIFLKEGAVLAVGGPDIVTPEVIAAVYGVPVTIKKYGGAPVVIPLA